MICIEPNDEVRIAKGTQVFVRNLSELPPEKQKRTLELLDAISKQQDVEANLEKQRGWRYMWQRTPKPYLLFLAYFVFLGSVGSFGYGAYSHVAEANQVLFMWVLAGVLILPLLPISFLSIYYIVHLKPEEEESARPHSLSEDSMNNINEREDVKDGISR